MKREIFNDEHAMFRTAVRQFIAQEVTPCHADWEAAGQVPRDIWRKAGDAGFLCMAVPEAYSGLGEPDFRYNLILTEEFMAALATGPGFSLHTDVVTPYLLNYASEEQKQRWLPQMITGETITAIAMTEPNAGSDLAGIQTTAVPHTDHYLLNGQKTFITNGILNDLVIVAAKTDPTTRHAGLTLLVVERGMEGYTRGRNLEKMGWHAQDTAELFFDNVRVPIANRLGEEGAGFIYLVQNLPQERLSIAAAAVAQAQAALDMTTRYCQERTAFGRPIGKFQNSRFKLAEMKTELEIAWVFLDRCVLAHNAGELTAVDAAMAKWWTTELNKRVIDQCLQLHGGYGYMKEYPIAWLYTEMRWQTIGGGSTEIMKDLIGRSMGF
ncbi:MAG: acyl-CoA dehydrogenase family protein [Chloroflexi bacterium]|nr:acyl-CoA dehydrogenase family protein [Chloroflexota bacterium]MBP7042825.1 acyl-CoA dehydrogenase family protein [Chloroflexota bacterium]